MKTETDRKLYTYVTGVNTLDKYKEEHYIITYQML